MTHKIKVRKIEEIYPAIIAEQSLLFYFGDQNFYSELAVGSAVFITIWTYFLITSPKRRLRCKQFTTMFTRWSKPILIEIVSFRLNDAYEYNFIQQFSIE